MTAPPPRIPPNQTGPQPQPSQLQLGQPHPTQPQLQRPNQHPQHPSATRTLQAQHPDTTEAAVDEPRLSLSVTQVVASMSAAVIAAMIGSKLGVAGTLTGAALASVVSVVGGAVFGHSLLMGRRKVTQAVLQVRGVDHPAAGRPGDPAGDLGSRDQVGDTLLLTRRVELADSAGLNDRTEVIPAMTRHDLALAAAGTTGTGSGRSGSAGSVPAARKPGRSKVGRRVLIGAAAAGIVFVSSLGAVTVVEAVKGSPLSGGDSGGLSVLGGNGGSGQDGSGGDTPATIEVRATTPVTPATTVTETLTTAPTAPTSTAPTTAEQAPSTSAAPTSTTGRSSSAAPSTTASSSAPSSVTTGSTSSAAAGNAG